MADDKQENTENTDDEKASKKSKKGLFLGGGITSLIAAAYMLFLVATPKIAGDVNFRGPFVVTLCQASPNVQANLKGDGGKRFVSMVIKVGYHAYNEDYAAARAANEIYQARERDVILLLSRSKSKEDLLDQIGVDVYKRELRDALAPLLFPVHVGNPKDASKAHDDSGLQRGDSINHSTMRAGFHAHSITIDAFKDTIQLDQGPPVTYTGKETDLQLENEFGQFVFVNTTMIEPGFQGVVNTGTFGRISEILFDQFIIQ
ncbi:MAG: flagellar basal body-associated protein FliL [Planctomycetota bacterium]|jgi:flagellar basal body-associated protein FliL